MEKENGQIRNRGLRKNTFNFFIEISTLPFLSQFFLTECRRNLQNNNNRLVPIRFHQNLDSDIIEKLNKSKTSEEIRKLIKQLTNVDSTSDKNTNICKLFLKNSSFKEKKIFT